MPLLWISLCLIAGLLLGKYLPWSGYGWLVLATLCLAAWPALLRLPARGRVLNRLRWIGQRSPRVRWPPVLLPPAALLACLFLGAARFAFNTPNLSTGHVAAYNDRGAYRLRGVIAAPPDLRDRSTQLRVQVESITPLAENGQIAGPELPAHGLALALLPGRAAWQYGDRVTLQGSPVTPPEWEDFSYREYLARQDVYTYLTYPRVRLVEHGAGSPILAAIYQTRDWAYQEVFHLFPAPEAPLLAGILLGLDNDLPEPLVRAFQDTGTAHVIAISGFNIAILAGLFSYLFGRMFSRWWALAASALAISIYTLMVGATPSVVRAAIMGCLSLLAQQVGRRSAGLHTLVVTAGIMCLQNPHMPWDASFQLSFAATAGLILYGERFQTGFTRLLERRLPQSAVRKVAGPVGEYLLLTLAAQLMTLPVILYHFQRLSFSALLANPLILPPQPLVMVLSGAAVLIGGVSDPLGHALAWLAWPFSAYTNRMVELLASIPGGVLALGEMGLGTVALMYALVLAPLAYPGLPVRLKKMVTPALALTCAGLVAVLLVRAAFSAPDGRLHLVVFNMEGSQVLLVRAPAGETLLVGSGPSARQMNDALDRWLSPFDRRLDGLLLNTTQPAVVSGLEGVIENHTVGSVWWGNSPTKIRGADAIRALLRSQAVEEGALGRGDVIAIGPQVRLQVLAAAPEGSTLLLTWGRFRTLIPGGCTSDTLAKEDTMALSALILSECDPETAVVNTAAWRELSPQVFVQMPGNGSVAASGANWISTPPGGWVQLETDGERMWVTRSR